MNKKIEILIDWLEVFDQCLTIVLSLVMVFASVYFLFLSIGEPTPDRALYFCAGVLALILESLLLKRIERHRDEEMDLLVKKCNEVLATLGDTERSKLSKELDGATTKRELRAFTWKVIKKYEKKK